jgi:hypothetical protein
MSTYQLQGLGADERAISRVLNFTTKESFEADRAVLLGISLKMSSTILGEALAEPKQPSTAAFLIKEAIRSALLATARRTSIAPTVSRTRRSH